MYTVNFKREDTTYQMEVSQEEYQELLEAKRLVQETKLGLNDLIDALQRVCPERVKRIVTEMDLT